MHRTKNHRDSSVVNIHVLTIFIKRFDIWQRDTRSSDHTHDAFIKRYRNHRQWTAHNCPFAHVSICRVYLRPYSLKRANFRRFGDLSILWLAAEQPIISIRPSAKYRSIVGLAPRIPTLSSYAGIDAWFWFPPHAAWRFHYTAACYW